MKKPIKINLMYSYDEYVKAFHHGWNAAKTGKAEEDNPYLEMSNNIFEQKWREGHKKANEFYKKWDVIVASL